MKAIRSVLAAVMIAGGFVAAPVVLAKPPAPAVEAPYVAVGPQYDTTHV